MSGSTDAGRLLVRIEATTAQLRQELQAAQARVVETAGKIDDSLKRGDKAFDRLNAASKEAQKAIEGLSSRLGPLGGALSALGTAGAAAGAGIATVGVGLVGVAKAGDAAIATLAKLNTATGSVAAAQTAYEGLFRLSQQTGIAVAESAGAFTRFAVAAKEIGGTNDQILRLVSGIQKAGIVAGSSAEETKSATQQLAQALASGVLQGDELRSLLENMPQLAQLLARELGVGIGQLRKMGEEGKLTADTVFPALLAASEKMNAEFEKMPSTMGRAFGILGESMVNFAANLDKALGLSQAIARAAMDAARAVGRVNDQIFPSERQRVVSARDAAQQRLDKLRADLATDQQIEGYRFEADRARLRRQNEETQRFIRAAESELRTHNDTLAEIDKEGARERFGEQVTAQQRAEESRRQAARRSYDEKRGDWDKEWKLRDDARKKIEVIDKAEREQSISSMEATRDRARVNEELAEGLEKLAKSTDKVGASTRAAGKAAQDADAHVKDWYKAQEKAAQEAVKAQEKAAEAIQRYHESSFDAVAAIGERAMDRVGDALVQAFVQGEGAAVNFGNIARGVLGSVVADLTKLAVVNPLLNSLFTSTSGPRPTLAAAFGSGGTGSTTIGFGDALGLGRLFGGGSTGGFLSQSLIEPGLVGGAIPGAPIGGLTIGGLLGGVGMGAGVGGLLAGLTGGNAMGGSIGGALGGGGAAALAAIPAVAGFLGPLAPFAPILGGLLGGGLGGLIGPGESVKGYGYQLNAAPDGLLKMGASFYNDTGAAAFKEAEQGIAALNAYLGARGLTVGGASIVGGNKDGADYSNATAGSFAEGVSQLYYHSNNAQLEYALAQRGNRFGSSAEMQTFVDGFFSISDIIKGLTEKPLPAFEQQMKAVNDNFDAAAAKAREYSLAEDDLNRARAESIAKLEEARTEQLRQTDTALQIRLLTAKGDAQGAALAQQAEAARQEINSLTAAMEALSIGAEDKAARLVRLEEVQAAERAAIIQRFGEQAANNLTTTLDQAANAGTSLLRELTYGSSSALAPEQRYFAAISDLSAARQALDAGGSLSAYTAVAQAVLPVARDFLGTSTRYAGLAAEVGSVIASKGGDGNLAAILSAQANGMDGLQATLASLGTQQISVATNTLNEMRRLSSLIEAWITRNKAA